MATSFKNSAIELFITYRHSKANSYFTVQVELYKLYFKNQTIH